MIRNHFHDYRYISMGTLAFTETIPLSLYIHLPWCVQKCPYCDFNSHPLKTTLPEQAYIDALINDLDRDLPKVWGRRLVSIFIGGGTPSLFSGAAMEKLFSAIRARLPFTPGIEITLEANPGTVDESHFHDYRQIGINRLSLGVQSFHTSHLKRLGRIHDDRAAHHAVDIARQAGFTNINIDLMHGLPQQTTAEALADLTVALNHQPTHLSWYQLTLEPNTAFYHQPPPLPEDDVLWDILQQGGMLLKKQQYANYEVSAYAKEHFQCQHNLNYWEFGDYLGIGAGAHSKITDMHQQQVMRFHKYKHPKQYLSANDSIQQHSILSAADLIFDFMLNALRLNKTIPMVLFSARTGLTADSLSTPLAIAAEKGLLQYSADWIRLTKKGRLFLNDVTCLFLQHVKK